MTAEKKKAQVNAQIELFTIRCLEIADRSAAGGLPFIEAVDFLKSAADLAGLPEAIEESGLIDTNLVTGDDVIQHIMGAAFANARNPAA